MSVNFIKTNVSKRLRKAVTLGVTANERNRLWDEIFRKIDWKQSQQVGKTSKLLNSWENEIKIAFRTLSAVIACWEKFLIRNFGLNNFPVKVSCEKFRSFLPNALNESENFPPQSFSFTTRESFVSALKQAKLPTCVGTATECVVLSHPGVSLALELVNYMIIEDTQWTFRGKDEFILMFKRIIEWYQCWQIYSWLIKALVCGRVLLLWKPHFFGKNHDSGVAETACYWNVTATDESKTTTKFQDVTISTEFWSPFCKFTGKCFPT